MIRPHRIGLLALLGICSTTAAKAEVKTDSIKVATLAPAESPWGQVFKVWQRAIRERTKFPDGQKSSEGKDSSLDLTFFWNGQQGDEGAVVAKMKNGQLDGGAITSVGLSQIYRPTLILQIPGLFTQWDKLDRARNALKPEIEKAINAAGFTILGWGDVGLAHAMSKGFPLASPGDVRGKKPWMWREDPISPIVWQVVGGVTPVAGSVPEVLPMLNTGTINVLTTAMLSSEQLQWASRLDHVSTEVAAAIIGAQVVTNKKLESLTADQREILMETGRLASLALVQRIRKEDNAAYERMKGKMTVTSPTEAQHNEWQDVYKQVRARLAQGIFPKELVARVEELAQ